MNPLAVALQGLGYSALLVAVQGFSLPIVLVQPPTELPAAFYNVPPRFRDSRVAQETEIEIAATVRLTSIDLEVLLAKVQVSGGANLVLISGVTESAPIRLIAGGAANATMLGLSTSTKLGKILAKGKHDLTEAEILSLLLALIA